ncbi:872_t:CDS:1, partial [Scutellospora calospora]
MFLNNKLFDDGICNGTIGLITKLRDSNNIEVTFPTYEGINKVTVQKETSYFEINSIPASQQQFLLQNAFSLTTHK